MAEASHSNGTPSLTIATKQLPSAILGTPYVAVLDATGGTPGYKWAIAAGQLPSGLSLTPSTGILSGTPTVGGNFSISLAATDSGDPAQVKSAALVIAVAAPALKMSISALSPMAVGSPYSQTLETSGGTAPYAWFISSGTLPAGLSLSPSTGVISGTPTLSGTNRILATVHDSSHPMQTYSIPMMIRVAAGPLKIATVALPSVTSGATYSQTLQASGGTPAYEWSISSGSLPAGLTLAPSGNISGTPKTSGVANFTVTVADHSTPLQTVSAPFSISVGGIPLTIATPALGSATVGVAYSQGLKAIGGSAPYSWSITSGSLPAGITIVPSTGLISGVPTTSGGSTFTATVIDSESPRQSLSLTALIVVAPTPLKVVVSNLPSVTVGSPYAQALQAAGGTAPYSWSVTSGSLPAGLMLSSNGTIAGTPTTNGTFSFTATVTDSSSPVQTVSAGNTVVIKATALTVVPPALPAVRVGTAYSKALSATGGVGPYVWSITSGRLPQGLNLASDSGTISGIPTASGVSNFTATVTDSGNPAQSAPAAAAIVVAPTLLAITSSALTSTTVGANYSQSLQASGGSAPYSWTVTSGALPAGLSFTSSTGVVSGTPTAAGSATFTATVTDSSNPAQLTSTTNTISVTPPLTPPAIFTPLVLSITTGSLPSITVGSSYSQTLQASGGTSPYTWTLASGQLPAGLSLSASGSISGIPTSSSAASFSVSVTDTGSPAQTQSAGLTIGSATSPLSITSSVLLSATAGTSYSQAPSASGGTPAYTWAVTSGSLPPGLTMAATTGVISGTPTANGTSTFTMAVHDNGNPVQTQSVATSIAVVAPGPTGPGTTWFIRPDGGTRYSSVVTTGQCDGLADAAYPGSGTNQHCAFKDFRYTWDDGSYGNYAWVIAGGDTVVIRGCGAASDQQNASNPNCRIGWDTAAGSGSAGWCAGSQPNTNCFNPAIPAGTSGAHTRILGGCAYDGTCNPVSTFPYTSNNLTQVFGGFGAGTVLNLSGTTYVDIEGLEITSHNGACSRRGTPAYPADCSTSAPISDYATQGISTGDTAGHIVFQDVYVHGMNESGFFGSIGGPITMTRVISSFNAFAGYNFDDGNPDGAGSSVTASYVWMEGNGCQEEYPIVHTGFPALSCHDSSSGGFGDSWSGQGANMDSFSCDHCTTIYNTKDGFIGPHTLVKNLSLTHSQWYGNMGSQLKWGTQSNGSTLFQDNFVNGNCYAMSDQIPGSAQNFNRATGLGGSYLTGYCRAAGAPFAITGNGSSTFLFSGNTIVANIAQTTLQMSCVNNGTCATTTWQFTDNIFLGYAVPGGYGPFGGGYAPALYFTDDSPSTDMVVNSDHNLFYGLRTDDCTGGYGSVTLTSTSPICSSPLLAGQPASYSSESVFYPLIPSTPNLSPSGSSPAINAGVAVSGMTTDYYNATRPAAPTAGAIQP